MPERRRLRPTRLPGRSVAKRVAVGVNRVTGPPLRRLGFDTKGAYEFAYWRSRQVEERTLGHGFYRSMFTDRVGLDVDFYRNKRILDVGCGPRGSLEWADHAAERVGLDPLADRYRKLGTDRHRMRYVTAGAESIPFDDGHFDVVTSFNSLDHVDDARAALTEMARVLAPGGTLVVIVDIHRRATVAEPQALPWSMRDWLAPHFEVVDERHYEKSPARAGAQPYDHDDPTERYGVLLLRAIKR